MAAEALVGWSHCIFIWKAERMNARIQQASSFFLLLTREPGPWGSATHVWCVSLSLSLNILEISIDFLRCTSQVTLNPVKLIKKSNYYKQWHYPHWVFFGVMRLAFHDIADSLVGQRQDFSQITLGFIVSQTALIQTLCSCPFIVVPFLWQEFGEQQKVFQGHGTWHWCDTFFSDKI